MTNFIKELLKPMLNDDVSDDIINYILTINTEEDFEEFMQNIIDPENKQHVLSYNRLRKELFERAHTKTNDRSGQSSSKVQTKKPPQESNSNDATTKKKKGKYTNFYTKEDKPNLRKGRHPCNCQATVHELINNCTKCGRIVCEQEGSGPCLFCDNMVCTRAEMEVLNNNTKESSRLYNHLVEQKKTKEFKQAVEHRNRLLKTDQMGVVQNRVLDDQNDYFDMQSKWLNEDDRDSVKRRYRAHQDVVHRSRREFKLALDFASRTVTVDDNEDKKRKEQLLKGVNKLLDSTERRFPKNLFEGDKAELIEEIVKLMECSSVVEKTASVKTVAKSKKEGPTKYRIANNEFLESVDQGMCLSMHQPWASLLVAGIKRHEGRTWRTEHRGRLWIAAAAVQPEDEDILQCEQMYRVLYDDPTLEFPKKYPTSCLLGCVIVEDCLDQNTYQQKYPDGDSNSPYVLICSSPVILPIFYPMSGQHKIFSLSKDLHKTAKAALMSSKWI